MSSQLPGLRRQLALAEAGVVMRLALPAMLGQIALTLMGLLDTLMVTRLGTNALAATSLGAVWSFGTLLPAMGVLFGMDPIVSQAHGANDGARCVRALRQGLFLSLAISIPLLASWVLTKEILVAARQDALLADTAEDFVLAQAFSAPFFLVFIALRQYLAGRGIVKPAAVIAWIAVGVNALLNWMLIFGHLGFEAMGVVGSGIATGLARVFMCVVLGVYTLRVLDPDELRAAREGWSSFFRGLREMLGHGLALGAQLGLEVWGFHAAALCAGLLGATSLAAHSIVLQLASFTFMVPMGLSIAAATRVGNLIGAGHLAASRLAGWVSLALGALIMSVSALGFLSLRHVVPPLFGAEATVLALAASIMPIAGAFQVFDGLQVVGCGVLRGRGDTKPAMLFNFIGYYVLGLPLGALMAFRLDLQLPGVWWGLTIGLATVALLLVRRMHRTGLGR